MNSRTEEGKLSSIYPIVSDWHKRVKLLKVNYIVIAFIPILILISLSGGP